MSGLFKAPFRFLQATKNYMYIKQGFMYETGLFINFSFFMFQYVLKYVFFVKKRHRCLYKGKLILLNLPFKKYVFLTRNLYPT